MAKYKMIDLFAGCGGLEDGFLQTGKYTDIAAVEWLKPQVNTHPANKSIILYFAITAHSFLSIVLADLQQLVLT